MSSLLQKALTNPYPALFQTLSSKKADPDPATEDPLPDRSLPNYIIIGVMIAIAFTLVMFMFVKIKNRRSHNAFRNLGIDIRPPETEPAQIGSLLAYTDVPRIEDSEESTPLHQDYETLHLDHPSSGRHDERA